MKTKSRIPRAPLTVLHEDDTAYEAARAMADHNIGCAVVCDAEGRLSGIVTDRDLVVRAICEGIDPGVTAIKHVMTRSPASVAESDSPDDASAIMRRLGVRRVPVVDERGHPVALITLDDLLNGAATGRAELRAIVARQLVQPARLAPEGASHRRGAGPSPHSVSPETYHVNFEEKADSLHRARAEQTLGRLVRLARSCLESSNVFALDRGQVLVGLRTFLNALVRRVNSGAASNFIAQLPSQLHDELEEQPAGPDVSIDREVVERLLRRALHIKGEEAGWAFDAYAEAVALWVARGEVHALCAQLPAEMRIAFEQALIPAAAA